MQIHNFGSCCIDNVYQVPTFVRPGETLPCTGYEVHPGGKGLNQSLALARAGADVRHAGKVGNEGRWLIDLLKDSGVDTTHLVVVDAATAHANIQVTPEGENAIVLFGGANKLIAPEDIPPVMANVESGDFLLLQNETSELALMMQAGADADAVVAFNAAPFTASIHALPLQCVKLFIVNELEGAALVDHSDPETILERMRLRFPAAATVLTLGEAGALYSGPEGQFRQAGFGVDAVDSTGAGDTFTGYFLASLAKGEGPQQALRMGCLAAALSVTRAGAATSIPTLEEVVQAGSRFASR